MSSTEIYGHHINLPEPNPGGMVTDVIVLARIVHMDGAQTRDMLAMTATTQTTGIVQLGMISAAGASCSEWDEED